MRIVMPLAGRGSRFSLDGHTMPKPLVQVAGHPLIHWATCNLDCDGKNEWLFIVREEQSRAHPELSGHLRMSGNCVQIHELAEPTISPVHTLHAARKSWLDSGPLLITNCDQFLAVPANPWMENYLQSGASVGVLTVETNESHFVHLEIGNGTAVSRVVGKVSSDLPASAGYYFFRSGRLLADIMDRALAMILPRPELCVTDIVATAVEARLDVQAWSLGALGERYFALGDPGYIKRYEQKMLLL